MRWIFIGLLISMMAVSSAQAYTIADTTVDGKQAKVIEFPFSFFQTPMTKADTYINKTAYNSDCVVSLKMLKNITEEITNYFDCNCKNVTYETYDNKTSKKVNITKEECASCNKKANVTKEGIYDIEDGDKIVSYTKIYEIFDGCKGMSKSNGGWGCSCWTDLSIASAKIEGATWWNTTFLKCREVTNTTAFTASETEFTFNNSGIPYADFMANFVDLRITNGTECTSTPGSELKYWRHPICNQSSTTTNCTIYINLTTPNFLIYYNATGVNDVSNGWKTFRVFDDFNRANAGALGANWTNKSIYAEKLWSIQSNQAYSRSQNYQSNTWVLNFTSQNITVETQLNISATTTDAYGDAAGIIFYNITTNYLVTALNNGTNKNYNWRSDPSNVTTFATSSRRNVTYNVRTIWRTNNVATFYADLYPAIPVTLVGERIYPGAISRFGVGLYGYGNISYFDNFRARIHIASPATWSVGAAETQGGAPATCWTKTATEIILPASCEYPIAIEEVLLP